MVFLVTALHVTQDLRRVFLGRLLHQHGLEAALQRRVALDVLAVVVEGGGADDANLATRQGWLQDVGGVDGAFGGARAHQRVHLIDEEDAVARGLDLFQHLLQALLELAAVLGAGDQSAHVEGDQTLAVQGFRHVIGDDLLGQRLHDSGLADAGLAHEHGVVLGPAGEDLNGPLQLLLAAPNGVQLVVAGQGRQVDAQLVEDRCPGRCGGAAAAALLLARGNALAEQPLRLRTDLVQRDAQALKNARGHSLALSHEADEQVLGPDVVVGHAPGFVDS